MKEDLKKLDRFSEEQDLIISNAIKSTADIDSLITDREEKIRQLTDARQKLRNKFKTAVANNNEDQINELKDKISDYSVVLKTYRKEIRAAKRVKKDVEHITENTENLISVTKNLRRKQANKKSFAR